MIAEDDKRVVVTGISMVSPIGIGKKDFWNSILKSKSGISLVKRFDTTNFRCKVGGMIDESYNHNTIIQTEIALEIIDKSTSFAIGAIKLAIEDSGYALDTIKENAGCCIGIAIGGADYGEKNYNKYLEDDFFINPNMYNGNVPNGCAYHIGKIFQFRKGIHTISTGCTSSTDSISLAYKFIQSGKSNIMLAGGTDAPITPLTFAAFGLIRALSGCPDAINACRPFDLKRDGFIPSEGSCFLVLETLKSAKKRSAKIYAEILGTASTSNAYHMVHTEPSGKENIRAIQMALQASKLAPEKIDYFNAHGSSTQLNDSIETIVIKKTFKSHANKIKISSTKSMHGHMLGATGAIEIATTCLSIDNGIIPPTINYENIDKNCDLDYTPNYAVDANIKYAISNGCGYGGFNSVVVLGKI